MNRININNFEIEQLQIVLEHLKLGRNHLERQLTPKQFKELESYGTISRHEKSVFKINKMEEFSHLAMVLNSVITGILGVWMGFAATMEIDASANIILVAGISLFCGGIMSVGILFSKMKETRRNMSYQKLQIFESNVFSAIYQKQKERLNKCVENLKKRYRQIEGKEIEKEPETFEKKADFFSWFYLFHRAIYKKIIELPKEHVFQGRVDEIMQILKKAESIFIQKAELVASFGASINPNKKVISSHGKHVLEILVDPSLSRLNEEVRKKNWHKKELFEIVFSLFPTILGALGSILMWCNSGHLLHGLIDIQSFESYLPGVCVSYLKMSVVVFFTTTFLFLYCYLQKKSYERMANMDAKKQELLNQEASTVKLSQCVDLIHYLDLRVEEVMKYFE